MDDPNRVRVTLMLCDWADAIGGKLYMQGAGWNKIKADTPATIAIAALIQVPYDQTNTKHEVTFQFVDGDGQPFPPESNGEPMAMAQFEVGRPAGTQPGEEFNIPFSLKMAGIAFPAGNYQIEARVAGEVSGMLPFRAVGDP